MALRFIAALSITASMVPVSMVPIASAAEFYFPADDWETIDPKAAGWDPVELTAAIDFAMSRKSSGVVVLYQGRILAERYQELRPKSFRYAHMVRGQDSAGQLIEDVASVQKSVVSLLVGVAQEKELLKLDDPVHRHLSVGWSKATPTQESAITIRHLITMSSGLNDKLEFVSRPGTKWKYNTTAYSQSLRTIEAASGKSANELTREWLTHRIGMQDSRWVERTWAGESSVPANHYGFATTARDLARFGLLILRNGKWEDQVVLADQRYLQASLSPSQDLNPSYGFLWWLNGQRSAIRGSRLARGPLVPTAPRDLVGAFGALGRKCYVTPSMKLVITRLGDSPDTSGKPAFESEFWRLLMKAAPN